MEDTPARATLCTAASPPGIQAPGGTDEDGLGLSATTRTRRVSRSQGSSTDTCAMHQTIYLLSSNQTTCASQLNGASGGGQLNGASDMRFSFAHSNAWSATRPHSF
eukprot:CAMPEP_0174311520 /NCGR_PEP_ID=MMETSP0810-20121108/3752_1 /TAXON_ID=73025 ORGANISM="Eutreptiella gymnastica-like, Strain CCMP1594" /NCGR_SAMPLE_ID=MMETSP0810 /ASSEMBLY_ACC=CAM_ASM_000659 /LENGTH=105 /DNA_ID=CAMNT_0015419755 /DNA_START=513 /DNA_END=830 /DNA_ORIENTATION=+